MQPTEQLKRRQSITSSLQSALWNALEDGRVYHNLVHAPVKLRQSVHKSCSFLLVNGIRVCGSLQPIHADSDMPPVDLIGVISTHLGSPVRYLASHDIDAKGCSFCFSFLISTHHADRDKLSRSWSVQVGLV